ncbi:PmeII family type II restriction endonuclease [Falsiroseomonas sp.]|uniref:PmeII family type II restriction endonuclease n=1 Tax=Falsiroseomonas sp. TaxID=2870721 RepID=UPI00271F083F|nr:PmeII family type II restriction endonuclease [Falsiroseomonas sp.]MDO9499661.1 PmeII family type II restriction endonuclease [Falsiroseomonas sp.]
MDHQIKAEVQEHAERDKTLAEDVSQILGIAFEKARILVTKADLLYKAKMTQRFTDLRFRERLKRTNPFLMQVRGLKTVRQWAETQVASALYASEEEAVGHVLEMVAKICHPQAREPTITDDFDFEVAVEGAIRGYQVKMSWDCMPMSSRKNLSNTIDRLTAHYSTEDIDFKGYFAPCYGSISTRRPPGQKYITIRSRDFWAEVGSGDADFDAKVGEVCRLLFSEFRSDLNGRLIPELVARLAVEGVREFGDSEGDIDYRLLFRAINR